MRVFVTGANGFIGSAVVKELIRAGHSVVGLARTSQSAARLRQIGAAPHPGDLADTGTLHEAASRADGVIHLAFMHGPFKATLRERARIFFGGLPTGIVSRFLEATIEVDRGAIDAIGSALRGSGRPFVTTFGTLGLTSPGRTWSSPATEEDTPDPQSPGFVRALAERSVEEWAHRGVRTTAIRLPPTVHGEGDAGLIPQLIKAARKKSVSAYLGDGLNRWPAVHRDDAARLFRLALENGEPGARYHGIAEQGIALRDIAGVIGTHLELPCRALPADKASKQFGWLSAFVGLDNFATSAHTRTRLAWQPTQSGLLKDLEQGGYFSQPASG